MSEPYDFGYLSLPAETQADIERQMKRPHIVSPEEAQRIEDAWCNLCPACDGGLPAGCSCPAGDHRAVILDLTRTVATEPARTRAAVVRALELAFTEIYSRMSGGARMNPTWVAGWVDVIQRNLAEPTDAIENGADQ